MGWQAVASIATFAAVIVALIPIWREWFRQKAHARSLRIRLCCDLTTLRPSLRTLRSMIVGNATHGILSWAMVESGGTGFHYHTARLWVVDADLTQSAGGGRGDREMIVFQFIDRCINNATVSAKKGAGPSV